MIVHRRYPAKVRLSELLGSSPSEPAPKAVEHVHKDTDIDEARYDNSY